MTRIITFFLFYFSINALFSQGVLTGNFQLNLDLYDRDSAIGAANIENYDKNKSSANSWLFLNYIHQEMGLDVGLRLDLNYNSMIQNPPQNLTANGIGYWHITKKIKDLEMTGGSLYEQFGSGVALRSFEDRSQGIDNSIFGARVKYNFSDKFKIKAIVGVQKDIVSDGKIYDLNKQFIKAINAEYSIVPSDEISFNLGASIVNRTLDPETRNAIQGSAEKVDNFTTNYNANIYHLYNTLNFKNLTWYIEGAYKSDEAMFNPYNLKYFKSAGTSFMTALTYSIPKFGVTLQSRRTDNFQFLSYGTASTNFSINNNRRLSFIAPINRQNSLRLPARFQVAPQDIGEWANSIDFTFSPFKKVAINVSACIIDTTNFSDPFYRELYADIEFKKLMDGKMHAHFGGQYVFYNQLLYMREGEKNVEGYTAFSEASYKFDRKKSIRAEIQYQHAEKELGQSVFALVEYNVAPHWSFSVSDLYNFTPNPNYFIDEYRTPHHFYSLFAAYTAGTTRFTLGYVKQLQGIVCTGGVCRIEPAFSGIRAQFTSSF